MPKLRVHGFSISLDGYGAEPNQDVNNRSGSAAPRCTNGHSPRARFGKCLVPRVARPEPTTHSPPEVLRTSAHGSWDGICSDRCAAPGPTRAGKDGGVTIRPTMYRYSCLRITHANRSP